MKLTLRSTFQLHSEGNIVTALSNLEITPPALSSTTPIIFAHCSSIVATEARLLRQFNQYVSITPESEMHYGHGHPHSYLVSLSP